jgi:membrane-associated phospholipid phosphatase
MLPAATPKLLDPRTGSVTDWQARARWWLIAAAAIPTIILLHAVDRAAFGYFYKPAFRAPGFFLPDWYQLLRQTGSLTLWLLIGLLVWGIDARATGRPFTRRAVRRGAMLAAATTGAGLLAELGKIIAARERPMASGTLDYQGYVHHIPIVGPLSGVGNLGMPSSHAAVAFAAAFALSRLVPGSFTVMIFMALGCAWTRLLMGAHFLTDVAAGLAIAWLWVTWLRPESRLIPSPKLP